MRRRPLLARKNKTCERPATPIRMKTEYSRLKPASERSSCDLKVPVAVNDFDENMWQLSYTCFWLKKTWEPFNMKPPKKKSLKKNQVITKKHPQAPQVLVESKLHISDWENLKNPEKNDHLTLLMATRNPVNSAVEGMVVEHPIIFRVQTHHPRWLALGSSVQSNWIWLLIFDIFGYTC